MWTYKQYGDLFIDEHVPSPEIIQLPETVDLDEPDELLSTRDPVCFFIVGGNQLGAFSIDPTQHTLRVEKTLDREEQATHVVVVKASENCNLNPEIFDSFDPADDSLLKVIVNSTLSTRTDQEEHIGANPFVIDRDIGIISLNFDPQRDMKGYFYMEVYVNDSSGFDDSARVLVYLLRQDQRVKYVLRALGNITGSIVNVDELKVHSNEDGQLDKTRTDAYLHFVNAKDNSVMEVDFVLRLIDANIESLDQLLLRYIRELEPEWFKHDYIYSRSGESDGLDSLDVNAILGNAPSTSRNSSDANTASLKSTTTKAFNRSIIQRNANSIRSNKSVGNVTLSEKECEVGEVKEEDCEVNVGKGLYQRNVLSFWLPRFSTRQG
ncbi:hypothetical protein DAPPUDRAFT_309564 [Daphnia pulex]|uniref:Cadherin domain-containing protein n=1 Tax=Daphnia pulex TaxID=6669 RepID=E9FRV6_DAPPU|nr:hypothetical protein DAPPUDRAFT_309564 [Daphnia pulex]|eukprot:EFX90417.1 hypothetical protein DAPPUDRAFT_309564 [Daphnia pulex]